MKMYFKLLFRMIPVFLLVFGYFPFALAQDTSGGDMKSVEEMFGEGLSEEDYYRADRLLVTVATKTKVTAEQAPSIVAVITGEEIKNSGARNLVDVLRSVPGFDMTHTITSNFHEINIRGMRSALGNDKIKMMMNGHSLGVMYGGPYNHIESMPLSNIKQIEIIRGPGSALYGTGAFIGVVNLVTKDGGDAPSIAALAGGSYSTKKGDAQFSYKEDDIKLYAYADYYHTNGYDGVIEKDRWSNLPPSFSSAPGNMTNESEYWTVQTDIEYKGLYLSGFYQKLDNECPIGVAKALTNEDDYRWRFGFAELGYNFTLGNKGNVLAKAYYDYGEQDTRTEIFSEETSAAIFKWDNGDSIKGKPKSKNRIMGSEVTLDYEIFKGFQFVTGGLYEKYEMSDVEHHANANVIPRPLTIDGVTYAPMQYLGGWKDIADYGGNWMQDSERIVWALYGQGILDFKKMFSLERGVSTLSLTTGIRYDNYDDFGSTTNPRFGLVYAPIQSLYFKALYGTAFRAPGFKELYLINNPAVTGNKELEPEKISTMEGLIGYNITQDIKSTVTFFHIEAEDLIQEVNLKYENIGQIESDGMEAEFKIYFSKQKYAYLNMTWQDVKDTTGLTITSAGGQVYTQEDYNPGSIPELYGNIGVNFDITKYVIADVSINYVGERDRSEKKKWNKEELVQADQRDAVDDRVLLNTSVTFRNFLKGMEIQLSGYNLLDDEYKDPDPAGLLPDDMAVSGRSFLGKVTYSF